MAKRKLEVDLTGNDKGLGATFKNADRHAESFGSKMKGLGVIAGGALLGIAAGAGTAGAALFKIGQGFDAQFDTIIEGTGASGEALEGLKNDFKDVLSDSSFKGSDVATALADINTALGTTGEPLQDMTERMLNLSRVAKTDLSGTISNTTRMFGDWAVSTDEQAGALDKLWAISQATGTGIDDLSSSVVSYGAPLRQLGFGMEESLALFGKWNKEGVNTETIMGGVKQAIGKMAAAGEDVPTAFRGALETIGSLESDSEATAKAIEVFGQRAGPDMAAAIREGRFELGDLLSTLEGSDGSILRTAEATESFGEKWQRIKNRVLVGLEPLATRVFEGVGIAMDRLGPYIETFAVWFEAKLPGAIAKAQEIFDVWGPRVIGIVSRVGSTVTTVVSTVTGWFDTLTAKWKASADDVNTTGTRLQDVFDSVSETVSTVMAAVVDIVDWGVGFVTRIWDKAGDDIIAGVRRSFDGLLLMVDGGLRLITSTIDTVMAIFRGDWGAAWEGIKGMATAALDIVVGAVDFIAGRLQTAWALTKAIFEEAFSATWTWVKDTASDALDGVVDLVTGLPQRISDAVSGAFDALPNAVRAAVRAVAQAWNRLDVSIPRFEFPDWVPGLAGKGIGPVDLFPDVNVPALAQGGDIAPGNPFFAVLGDNMTDHEIVSPEPRMRAVFEDVLRSAGGVGGGAAQPVVIQIDGRELARFMLSTLGTEDRVRGTRIVAV